MARQKVFGLTQLQSLPIVVLVLAFGLATDGPSARAGAPSHEVALSGCVAEGPGPVSLSDSAGANMFIACDIANLGDHDDLVEITPGPDLLETSLPAGCTAVGNLIIPGRIDFVMSAGEEKRVLYKLAFECHAPAVPAILQITVGVTARHPATADENPGNNGTRLGRAVIIGAGTPEPTPPPTADSDGDGYTNGAEAQIGTAWNEPCGTDGWPSDLVDAGQSFNKLDVQDMTSFVAPVRRIPSSSGDPAFDPRWDLIPGGTTGGQISSEDMAALTFGASGYPPMFGGQRAFGKTCPPTP